MVVHTGGAMLSPMVSEWASAFVTSDTLHWEVKSVNQARQWRTSSQWTFVQCVHCAANIVTCDIPDIVHCANSLPVLCPASVLLPTRLRPRTYFTASLSAQNLKTQIIKWVFSYFFRFWSGTAYIGRSWKTYAPKTQYGKLPLEAGVNVSSNIPDSYLPTSAS